MYFLSSKNRLGDWIEQDEKLAYLREWMSTDLECLGVVQIPYLKDVATNLFDPYSADKHLCAYPFINT